MIKEKFLYYKMRDKIEKHLCTEQGSHLTYTKKKIIYEYYICDYCSSIIEIKDKKHKHEQQGGIVNIPSSVTGKGELRLVLCNKCLNKVLNEFE